MVVLQHHRSVQNPNSNGSVSQFGLFSSNSCTTNLEQFDFGNIQVPASATTNNSPQLAQTGYESFPVSNPQTGPDLNDPAVIRDILLSDPQQMSLLEQNNPTLAEALKKGDFGNIPNENPANFP